MITVKRRTINNNNPEKITRFVIIADVNGKNTTVYVDYTGEVDEADNSVDEAKCMNKLLTIESG